MHPVPLSNLIAATAGQPVRVDAAQIPVQRVQLDSRKIEPGDLFWAIHGPHHDGHNYLDDAIRRGAIACVVNENYQATADSRALSIPCVRVKNTICALSDFAGWYRQQRETMLIGVTGSVGKTTTRELIFNVLSQEHHGLRSPRNYNNEFGLPLTLLDIEDQHDFAVLEMAARHVGEIAALARITQPEIGVITSIAPCHVESFGSLENIRQGKGELFDALPADGFAVLPGDDPFTAQLASRAACRVILVGEENHNQIRASHVNADSGRLSFQVDHVQYELPVPARHFLKPALCAIAIALEIGMDRRVVGEGLRTFAGVEGRCQSTRLGSLTVIDDTYNASPASTRAAAEMLGNWSCAGQRIMITGDMLELGAEARGYHQALGRHIAAAGVERLLACGEFAEDVIKGAREAGLGGHSLAACKELDPLLMVLDCWLSPGDVVLAKGSRGMRMERVVDWLRARHLQEIQEKNARDPLRACA